jgi:hypothetical protein
MDSSTKLSVITPRKSLFDLRPDEIWYYCDLSKFFKVEKWSLIKNETRKFELLQGQPGIR